MGSVTVKIEGLKELGEAMRDLGDEVQKKLSRQSTRAAAGVVMLAAQQNAPVKTGALRDSIQTRRDTRLSHPGFEVVAVGVFKIRGATYANNSDNRRKGRVGKHYETEPPAYYWKFIEFGTVKMSPRSFLRKGFDEVQNDAAEKMANTLAVGIEKQTAKYK